MRNPYVVGSVVHQASFYGRKAIIADLLDARHQCVYLVGSRRIGKTSLLHQLRRSWGVQDGSVLFSLGDQGAGAGIAETLHRLGREIMRATPTLPYGVGHKGSSAEQISCQLIDLLNQIAKHRKAKPPFVVLMDDFSALAIQDRAPKTNPTRYLEMIVQHHDEGRPRLAVFGDLVQKTDQLASALLG